MDEKNQWSDMKSREMLVMQGSIPQLFYVSDLLFSDTLEAKCFVVLM